MKVIYERTTIEKIQDEIRKAAIAEKKIEKILLNKAEWKDVQKHFACYSYDNSSYDTTIFQGALLELEP